MKRTALLLGAALAPLAFSGMAQAQSTNPQDAPETSVEEVIVTGRPVFRNRTEDTVPTLSYDLEYFQRFEPLTVGDALKRVPSVTFLSDILEADGVRLRGLDPGYTQILINGERVPGGGVDRSFFVDRIPAELIERVEVVRSSSANRSGDAVAGAINIVLRDALTLDGGYVRAGAILFPDDEIGGTFGAVYGGQVGPGRVLLGASVQDRRNPKDKFSVRDLDGNGTVDNTEVQTDVRDGRDYSFNAAYEVEVGGGNLELSGVFVRTERLQDEDSIEYQFGIENDANLLTINDNDVDIETDNLALRGRYEIDMLGGETRFKLGYASFDDQQSEFENESEYLRSEGTGRPLIPFPDEDRFTADFEIRDDQDEELSGALEHTRPITETIDIEFGIQAVQKDRESVTDTATRIRFNVPNAPGVRPTQAPFVFTRGVYEIEETRIDPYVMLSGDQGALKWEAGLRYETTDTAIAGLDNDYALLLPSASLRYSLSDVDRLTLSVARTVRRPDFDDLAPVTLEEERGDNDFRGNPALEPETAWGIDVGFERRLGRAGVVGINAFYRDVSDLIEDINTGEKGSGDNPLTVPIEAFIESIDNVGNGEVYGLEFDLSTPLDFIGMENTGVFLNASYLDSSVEDEFGDRRFNDQSDFVYNFGFTHDVPTWGAALGATYRKQGEAFGRRFAEEITTSYGGDLEVFIEKQIGTNAVFRLTGSNLLDSSKDEVFDKFGTTTQFPDIRANQRAGRLAGGEFESETESAGPVFQAVLRVAF